jgi:hypothetical protein
MAHPPPKNHVFLSHPGVRASERLRPAKRLEFAHREE